MITALAGLVAVTVATGILIKSRQRKAAVILVLNKKRSRKTG